MQNNYYKTYEEQLKQVAAYAQKPRLLLHACCAPCSSHCIEELSKYFNITMFFYNPNIDEKEEYIKRFEELKRFISEAPFANGVSAVDGGYDPKEFDIMAKGKEELPEKGERCYDCYKIRMKKTAEYAAENKFDYFTTTLSISPYKNAEWINQIGISLEKDKEGNLAFLYSDFKKKSGYLRSIELSKEYNLYRQDYCGCRFSKAARDKKLEERM